MNDRKGKLAPLGAWGGQIYSIGIVYRIEKRIISKNIKVGEVFDVLSVLRSRIGSPSRDLSFVMVYTKIGDFMFQEFNWSYF